MASKGQSLTVQYVAWDTSANAGKTGDVANHTLRWVKDGTSAEPDNSPAEVDAVNAPGVYRITLTAEECDCWVGTLCGKSSTANVSIMPLTVTFEQLPTADAGANGGLPTCDANGYVDADIMALGGSTQSAADLKNFADIGYDPSNSSSRINPNQNFSGLYGSGNLGWYIQQIKGYVDCLPASWVTVPTAAQVSTQVKTDLDAAHGSGSWEGSAAGGPIIE